MIAITVIDKGPMDIMQIVYAMRAEGMVQGKDFDFAYHRAQWDNFSHEAVVNEHTVFTFYNEQLASWFSLKWL